MWLQVVRVFIIVCCIPCTFQNTWTFEGNGDEEWEKMAERRPPGEMPKSFKNVPGSDFLWLPDFLKVSSAVDQTDVFEPEMGSRPLPDSVQPILLPTTTLATPPPVGPKIIEMLCHLDRIYVRILRNIFRTFRPWRFLKLGNCVVNQGSLDHFYFLYLLTTDCGFTYESSEDHLLIKNVLHFLPTTTILRDMPFAVPLECKYHRYIHSYKVGIRPQLQVGTLHKLLRTKRRIVIIPEDAFGQEKTTPYFMGETVYFRVMQASGVMAASERLYILNCFVTPTQAPIGFEHVIIDNNGCMRNGKDSEDSMFFPGPPMAQSFSISAGVLLGMASMTASIWQFYMHCEVFIGDETPSESRKACNYALDTDTWRALYGDDSLCSCCDTFCSPVLRHRATKSKITKITSQPWKVNLNYEEDGK